MNLHGIQQSISAFHLLLLLSLGVAAGGHCVAQEVLPAEIGDPVVQGYITAVHLPGEFDINNYHIVLSKITGVGYFNTKGIVNDPYLLGDPYIGAYAAVIGDYSSRTRTVKAETIYLRDERTKVRTGEGLILSVVSAGPEPVYRADGYLIRIRATSSVTFQNGLHQLSDVVSNTMIQYKGRIGADGVMEATRVTFIPVKYSADKIHPSDGSKTPESAVHSNDQSPIAHGNELPGSASTKDNPRMWRPIPPDDPLQERVARIGKSLVPDYLREMAKNDPTKIDFCFYAIDDEKIRSGYAIVDKHTILVPKQTIERLQNDSQLAAILAEGLAEALERRRSTTGATITGYALGSALTGALAVAYPLSAVGLATDLVPSKYKGGRILVETSIQEQRDRVALGLMADAGYDPHQAPNVWRLVIPENQAPDPQLLPYPLRSSYEFYILATQYQTHTTSVTAGLQ